MAGNDRETRRLQMIADLNNLQTADDLDRFLANDVKTKDDARVRAAWRVRLQVAVPRLRDAGTDSGVVEDVLETSPAMDGAMVGHPDVAPVKAPDVTPSPIIIVSK